MNNNAGGIVCRIGRTSEATRHPAEMSVRAGSVFSAGGPDESLALELCRAFVDSLASPAVLLDVRGVAVFCNRAFDAAGGRTLLDACTEFGGHVRSTLEGGKDRDVVLRRPGLQLHGKLVPLRAPEGALLGAAATFSALFKSPLEIDTGGLLRGVDEEEVVASSFSPRAPSPVASPFGTANEASLLYSVLNRVQYEGIWLLDSEGRVLYANDAACRMNGYSRAEMLRTTLFDHDTEYNYDMWRVHWDSLKEAKAQMINTNHRKKSGEFMPVEVIASYLEHNGIGYNLALVRDITEQQNQAANLESARDEARAASLAKSTFLSQMSHELRTPFVGILGMLRLLLYSDLTPDQRDLGLTALRSAESLLGILDSILDLSKIEAGKVTLDTSPLDLSALSEDVSALYGTLAKEKGLELKCHVDAPAPTIVSTDASRLRQILVNLVGNAVKFTDSGTVELSITVQPMEPDPPDEPNEPAAQSDPPKQFVKCTFEVTDTGIGIPSDVLPRLFRPFVQADGSTTRKFGGTGLGLAISRELVNLLGGQLLCSSVETQGSRFWFTLVLEKGRRNTPQPVPPCPPNPTTTEKRISRVLLAEDNPVNRRVAQKLLERMGLSVDTANDGAEAVQLVSERTYDVVFMDVQMPRLDGYGATRLIRASEAADPSMGRIPIVALTANAMQGDKEACLEAGMDDYVKKPFGEGELRAVLARLGGGGQIKEGLGSSRY